MPQSDAVLFDKWRAHSDADAFAELLARHASMVYGACLRVVRNPSIAEEVAQECFVELMKGPRGVRCIGAWLHTVATRRALDRLKAEGRRSERERSYAATQDAAAEREWDDVREFVDEAITALPDELRLPVVLRFLEGRTHEAIAEELSVSRSTVRSRIDKGIGVVRENLVKRGVNLSLAVLSTGLETLDSAAAPSALVAELGRRALAMRSVPTFLAVAAGAKYAAAPLVIAAVVLGGAWASRNTEVPNGNVEVAKVAAAVVPEPPVPSETVETAAAETTPPKAEETAPALVEESEPVPAAEEEKTANGWKLDLTPSETLKEALQNSVNIDFRDAHIRDITGFLQDTLNVNLVLDQRVVPAKVEERLDKANTDLQYESSAPPGPVKFVRLPRKYMTDGQLRRVVQKKKTLGETLTAITSPLNLTYKIRGNTVWISSSAQIIEDMTVPLPSATFSDGEVLKTLASPANIEFEDIHISNVVDYMRSTFKLNITLDDQVIMPETRVGDGELPDTSQFATDGRIDYINMKDTSMAETLFVMTRLLNLSYRVDKDGVFISTPDRLKGAF